MTADQANQAIRDAISAVREYRREQTRKESSLKFEEIGKSASEVVSIKELTKDLVRESFMLSPAGQICPTCGGTGKI
jgi:hypothetical protein